MTTTVPVEISVLGAIHEVLFLLLLFLFLISA